MSNYCVTYRKDEFVRVVFKCDETLDPLNNLDDYDYVTRKVADNCLERFEVWTDGPHISEQSIDIEDCSENDDPEVVISRNGVMSYSAFLESGKFSGQDEDTQTTA
jgi:hypothetical protein